MAPFGGVAKPGARAASPTDSPDAVRPRRNTIPFPTVDVTARLFTARAKQEERAPSVAWQHVPDDAQSRLVSIGPLQFDVIVAFTPARDKMSEPHHFSNVFFRVESQ